jgi:hypothetical protein
MTTTLADIPLAYTHINFCMGGLISETGWDTPAYIFITQEVWRVMGITSEPTDTTEQFKYYALLKLKALEQFKRELSTAYDFKDLGVEKKRSQMFAQLKELVKEAKQEAIPYLAQYQIQVGQISFPDDPYSINGQIEHNP